MTGVGLILMPTFVGRLRPIKGLLSAEMFEVLARLNYIVYMIHALVLMYFVNNSNQSSYITNITQWFLAIGGVVISFICAIPFTLL